MFEIMKPINVKKNKPRISAIHGHTVIELKNIKTGKRERVESDNVVTDAIEYLLNDTGYHNILNRYSNASYGIVPALFGGIYLFDKAIPTSPMAKYMPAGTKMIGNGIYGVANGSAVTEMGSYDSVNSSIAKSSATLVWDFTTAQAIGGIKSICMGTMNGTSMGYGNSLSNTKHSSVSGSPVFYDYRSELYYPYNGDPDAIIIGNRIYIPSNRSITDTANQLLMYSKLAPMDEIDDFRYIAGISSSGKSNWSYSTGYWVSDFSFSFNAPNVALNYIHVLSFDEPVFVMCAQSSRVLHYYIFNIAEHTVTEKHINLTFTGSGGYAFYIVAMTPYKVLYAWRSSNTGRIDQAYILDINTEVSTRVHAFDDKGYSAIYGTYFADNVLFFTSGTDSSNSGIRAFDLVNDTIYYCNATNGGGSAFVKNDYNDMMEINTNTYSRYLGKDMMRLMTINNLSDTVIKTAADTMKVTYTLTME